MATCMSAHNTEDLEHDANFSTACNTKIINWRIIQHPQLAGVKTIAISFKQLSTNDTVYIMKETLNTVDLTYQTIALV